MVVRDLFCDVDDACVIARAIFEDDFKDIDGWITKYYALLTKLKNSKVRKSDMMFFLDVIFYKDRQYGKVTGLKYSDIKLGKEVHYGIEYLNYREYAALYVPEYTVQIYGKEVVAAEALREYGWKGSYDENIVCPDDIRRQVKAILEHMETGLFPVDKEYIACCRRQFKLFCEGK